MEQFFDWLIDERRRKDDVGWQFLNLLVDWLNPILGKISNFQRPLPGQTNRLSLNRSGLHADF